MADINRRTFVAGALGCASTLGLISCAPQNNEDEQPLGNAGVSGEEVQGEWKPAACWHNCAGLCLNKALVKDGVVVRMKSDDTHEDSFLTPQIRGCAKGRAQKQQVYSADRIKYPMKRKNWKPGGEGDNSLRGKDEWERISWDEALSYIADEVVRIRESYGNESLLVLGGDDLFKAFAHTGGYMGETGTTSPGHNMIDLVLGHNLTATNDRQDILNTEYIFMFGNNNAWNAQSEAMVAYQHAKANGTKFYGIDPFYNDTYAALEAEWIPIRPGTDTAFLAGMAYVMLTEDDPEKNPLIDWDFLERCTIGFTKDSIPEIDKGDESYQDYVLGIVDGIPKTPEWAAEQCDCDPEQIRMLGRLNGKNNAVSIQNGLANARHADATNSAQAFMTLACMGGHMGRSGHSYSNNILGNQGGGYGNCLWQNGSNGLPVIDNPCADAVVLNVLVWKSIEDGSYQRAKYDNRGQYLGVITHNDFPGDEIMCETRPMNTKLLYWGGMNGFGFGNEGASIMQRPDTARGVRVLRSNQIDSVFCNAYTFHPGAQWADIVLPVATPWEKPGYMWRCGGSPQTSIVIWDQVIEPLYEARTDQAIAKELIDRLGYDSSEVYPFGERQQFFNELTTATVAKDVGGGLEFVPLVSVTQDEIDAWGVEGDPQEGEIGLTELMEKGCYIFERNEKDVFTSISFEDFVNDPDSNPLSTESGKFEIYCSELKHGLLGRTGFGDYSPIARYIPGSKSYQNTKGDNVEFPFTLSNVHYKRTAHSSMDNIAVLQEAYELPLIINADDAADAGIETGDSVLITTKWGRGLRPARITNRVMPGHVIMPTNRWFDYDEDNDVDKAGSANWLLGPEVSGFGVFTPNSELCRIEKYEGPLDLPSDSEREIKTPGL